ncbi:MAG: 5-bromo-4-chloroindolyl phosphate hydrolysis family protein [Methylococcales bacterium]|nr:5-bromo-4-chloroindolyl phosphate hydrolysis family protein [Methylococcales bacterium]
MKETKQLRRPKIYQKKQAKGFRYNSRGILLYLLPIALVPATILSFMSGDFSKIIVNASGCTAFLIAAILLRKGISAEKHYLDKKITRAPKWPLKGFATVIVTFATTWVALLGANHPLMTSLAFGFGTFVGMFLFYGFDPRQEKMVTGSHGYSAEEIAQTVDEAQLQIIGIESANNQINNAEFNQRIRLICQYAEDIIDIIQDDPGDIRRARKFLNVYLDGALKVTEGYADMQQQHQSEQLTENFDNVLKTIESVFIEQKTKLLEDDILDLDVQIEVLSAQLKHEGVI